MGPLTCVHRYPLFPSVSIHLAVCMAVCEPTDMQVHRVALHTNIGADDIRSRNRIRNGAKPRSRTRNPRNHNLMRPGSSCSWVCVVCGNSTDRGTNLFLRVWWGSRCCVSLVCQPVGVVLCDTDVCCGYRWMRHEAKPDVATGYPGLRRLFRTLRASKVFQPRRACVFPHL